LVFNLQKKGGGGKISPPYSDTHQTLVGKAENASSILTT